ncbi:MAG: hypothetical protein LBG52_05720 [Candidatus Peribacteria bacterium]|jgi:hypothetical protein|nr:hypothetical protein [Candidatus Peribacteria bacterium]
MEAIVNKEFSGGISFFYVLQELLNDGYEWKIQDKTLYVGKNVGKDRTS